ncbi:flagellar motor switch protein FliN [Cellulomonas sp. SLBN-39]|uniref:flagellar motor switch protein FliN n=1 Tax=Cellulomonas sp. SLBN-39 TaxID=2768446 RepID=UPI00114E57FE|nr:flagellar motor switch protein FliN [Cellulomonas sp. SLBN-39]TQL01623.1 flagellar motor switch protein FliN/FliY [Cellulomonas sp. SLBN-39]
MSTIATPTDATVLQAAEAAAALVPAAGPLTVAPAGADRPGAGTPALVASVIGPVTAEVALVLGPDVVAALAAGGVEPADALRPALEAAAAALGTGVLEPTRSSTAGEVVGADSQVFALSVDGAPAAWCAVRVQGAAAAVPTQRTPAAAASGAGSTLRVLYDVEMTLTAEIGRTRLPLRQVLDLTPGTVLELDRTAGSPADIVVNGRLIARGEVVVVDEDYGVRVTEIVAGADPVG